MEFRGQVSILLHVALASVDVHEEKESGFFYWAKTL